MRGFLYLFITNSNDSTTRHCLKYSTHIINIVIFLLVYTFSQQTCDSYEYESDKYERTLIVAFMIMFNIVNIFLKIYNLFIIDYFMKTHLGTHCLNVLAQSNIKYYKTVNYVITCLGNINKKLERNCL